jgi:hypothetical protein
MKLLVSALAMIALVSTADAEERKGTQVTPTSTSDGAALSARYQHCNQAPTQSQCQACATFRGHQRRMNDAQYCGRYNSR